jgi:orotate phosphoribosyltransferase
MKVAVVDDTCTSGRSLFLAVKALEEAGCEVTVALCVLDRNEGGSAEVARRGYRFKALLSADGSGGVGPA